MLRRLELCAPCRHSLLCVGGELWPRYCATFNKQARCASLAYFLRDRKTVPPAWTCEDEVEAGARSQVEAGAKPSETAALARLFSAVDPRIFWTDGIGAQRFSTTTSQAPPISGTTTKGLAHF
ncbi:hypothetical protein AAFF_G00359220 [Aldrovandia affinis]|uniref:Uncharacterized protein n=1 Tax=Aldrovandia affinis TaxID=143900 RepID=A0AAD7SI30_9TELE|nr:hypothetical protein AAFF_G00359220 [Aldrovandia affinis]